LDDLAARFIINLPTTELESGPERICFQIEQAHWFYVDFLQPKNPKLVRHRKKEKKQKEKTKSL
jgi:mRNA-decapping enzyme subunit 2